MRAFRTAFPLFRRVVAGLSAGTVACAIAGSVVGVAIAQDDDGIPDVAYPALPASGAAVEAFVPKGWRLEHRVDGDLNKDGKPDAVLVLRDNDPANIIDNDGMGPDRFDTNPRMLAVLFAQPSGYSLALENHTLIPRADNPVMDDYLDGDDAVQVRRGAFTVSLHSWASAGTWYTSSTTFTFRHQDGCFRLIGYDSNEAHRGSGETTVTSVNYATGKATVEYGNFSSDDPAEKVAAKVKRKPLPCLQDIDDGFGFDPGIEAPARKGGEGE